MGVTTQKANYLTEWNKSEEESRFLRFESLFKELAYTGLSEKCCFFASTLIILGLTFIILGL